MDRITESIRERLIDLLGEAAWQYAYYNFDLKNIIESCDDIYQLAEKIQDLIARDLSTEKTPKS